MSTGGVFILVSNDGRMDQMLIGNDSLRDNIAAIKARRAASGEADTNPSLSDLERSHVLFVNAHFKPYVAISLQYFKVSANNVTLGSEVQLSIPQYGDFFADMVANVVISAPTTSYTPPSSGTLGASDVVLYRHCEYPGERLFEETRFEVNSNLLDSYTNNAYVLHRQFGVPADKRAAWNRCMGQDCGSVATTAVPDAQVTTAPVTRHLDHKVYNGYQTYKTSHQDLNLWIPQLFWFNQDARLAFPSVAVPYGQRFVTFRLTAASNLYWACVNPGAQLQLTAPTLSTPQISTFDLYINNLFLLPEVHDIFIDRVAFTLVRVHRNQTQNCNKSSDRIHLVQLKWPVEVIKFGFQMVANTASPLSNSTLGSQASVINPNMEDWHRYGQVTNTTVAAAGVVGAGAKLNIKDEAGHITTLRLQAHGVDLFGQFPAEFFNRYIPYQFGGSRVVAPTDPGLYMYTFALHPGTFQPSGHFNCSRARELYLEYVSSAITSSAPANFVVEATALNFLLIAEGSASLRYST